MQVHFNKQVEYYVNFRLPEIFQLAYDREGNTVIVAPIRKGFFTVKRPVVIGMAELPKSEITLIERHEPKKREEVYIILQSIREQVKKTETLLDAVGIMLKE